MLSNRNIFLAFSIIVLYFINIRIYDLILLTVTIFPTVLANKRWKRQQNLIIRQQTFCTENRLTFAVFQMQQLISDEAPWYLGKRSGSEKSAKGPIYDQSAMDKWRQLTRYVWWLAATFVPVRSFIKAFFAEKLRSTR